MVEAFFLPVEIVACPTVREKTGLAMSSRNRRLKPEQKILAAAFYRELSSSKSAAEVKLSLEKLGFEVDYIEDTETRRLGAVRIEGVRLIDNVVLSSEQTPKEVSRGTHP